MERVLSVRPAANNVFPGALAKSSAATGALSPVILQQVLWLASDRAGMVKEEIGHRTSKCYV